ncbi:site-2 protease family protein [candidate division WOR-3 bacterium]|nr:site-2 protease family protein [candidate division WOR-3 bacterium]
MSSPLRDLLNGDIAGFLSYAVAILIAITVHEFAHAKAAQMAGDPTPKQHGRVTLNPLAHFDPIGTIALLVAGFGWGRPVPVNPFLMKRPRVDNVLVSLWGPLSNFLVALVFALPFRIAWLLPADIAQTYAEPIIGPDAYGLLLGHIIIINLVLGIFNLIPVHPLDGSHILSGLLPLPQARAYDDFGHRYGFMVLLLLVVTGVTGIVLGPAVMLLFRLLTGV